jgi:hypothetical protein
MWQGRWVYNIDTILTLVWNLFRFFFPHSRPAYFAVLILLSAIKEQPVHFLKIK